MQPDLHLMFQHNQKAPLGNLISARHVLLCMCLIILCVSSFELVKSMLPAEHHKVLVNIRKAEARTKRRKQATEQQDDSESDDEAPQTKSER